MPGLDSEDLDFRAASESFAPVRRLGRADLQSLRLVTTDQGRIVPTINAVAHADYAQRGAPIRVSVFDDRLEVENPGLLPFGLTVEDLHRGISKLRNRVIGRTFHALGLIEQWGSGVQRMTTACRDAGLRAPVFEELGARFRVTLFTERTGRLELDEGDQAILDALADDVGRLTSEVARTIGLSSRAARTRLGRLVAQGLVRVVGTGPQDPGRRYFRSA